MNKKYFFFDIDGTLITDGGYGRGIVPESTKLALEKLRANGHFTALATGRSYALAKKFLTEYGFENMVSDGGNGITLNGVLQGVTPLNKEDVCALIKECDEKGFSWGLSDEVSPIRKVPNKRFIEETHDIYMDSEIVEGLDPNKCKQIYKAYVAFKYPKEFELESLKKLPWCRFGPDYIFVEPSDKAFGIRKVLEYVGGNVEDVVVFGDQNNDLSMFVPEWTSIAMGNATDEVKAKADYITTNVDDDGIYNACKHFGWID